MADRSANGLAIAEDCEAKRRAGILGADVAAGRIQQHNDERVNEKTDKTSRTNREAKPTDDTAPNGQNARVCQKLHVTTPLRRLARLRARAARAGAEHGDTARRAAKVQAYQVRRDNHGARGADARH